MIANKGQLFDTEFQHIVPIIVQVMASDGHNDVAEYAWYVQAIDNDERIGSSMTIQHREEEGGEEIKNLEVPVVMHVNGIDGTMLWRAGVDLINRVVGIRYRRRGT